MAVRRLIADPLTHFLALGLVIFLIYAAADPQTDLAEDRTHIVVDRDNLLTFLQFRTKTFQPEIAEKRFRAMNDEQKQKLINDYVREEALFRESEALGLGENDYIIKRRMIQKVDFIAQNFAEASTTISDKDIEAYYAANKDKFKEYGQVTFTHVFFSARDRGEDAARYLAAEMLKELNTQSAQFSDAPKHGERFPYGLNYVERGQAFVENHFGTQMAAQVFDLTADQKTWQGPFQSPYGSHVVMLVKRSEDRIPPLSEVKARVKADLLSERRREMSNKAINEVVKKYTVDIRLDDAPAKASEEK
ncbi:MAG: peptidyl-prolyl cis-trans isomerase [Hyphomicrobiales bacterium]